MSIWLTLIVFIVFFCVSIVDCDFVDWIPSAATSYESTICSCTTSSAKDIKPWITWGYITQLPIKDGEENLLCVILDNHGFSDDDSDAPTIRHKVEVLGDKTVLKRYFDYHIYFNDSSYTLNKSTTLKPLFTVYNINSIGGDWIYDPITKQFDATTPNKNNYFLYVKVLKTFRVYTKRDIDNGRTLEYEYEGIYKENCKGSRSRIPVTSFGEFLGL